MAILEQKKNSCEGVANGTTVTQGSGGNTVSGGDYFTFTTPTGSATCTYDTSQYMHGAASHLFTFPSGSSNYISQLRLVTGGARGVARVYARFSNVTMSANNPFIQLRSSAAPMAALLVEPTGKLIIYNSANAFVSGSLAPSALSANTWYRFELWAEKGTGTGDGDIGYSYYLGDSSTAQHTWSSNVVNAGTADSLYCYFGRTGSLSMTNTYWMDDYAYAIADGATITIGPEANAPPVVTAGADQTVPINTLVTLSASATDPDGTVASLTVVQSGGVTETLSGSGTTSPISRTFTPTVPGVRSFVFTATDNLGATGEDATVVNVTTTNARPQSLLSNGGGFTNEGGAASIVAALADESDATYAQSPAGPNGASMTVDMQPLGSVTDVTVNVRHMADAASPAVSRQYRLLQGSTVITTKVVNPMPTTMTSYSFTTTSGETALITTPRTDLRLEWTDTSL